MSTFTIQLWEALELSGGTTERIDGMTYLRGTDIGLEHYPIFDERHRDRLNSLIVDTYWNHEIGTETISTFRLMLSNHMNLHMPTFNLQYEAALVEYDPLKTVDMETSGNVKGTQTGTSDSTSDTKSNGKSTARNVYSDTPQTMLAGNEDYASNANDAVSFSENEANDKSTGKNESTSEGESVSRSTGYSMYPAQLVRIRQDLVLNVDLLVVESLQHLFFGLFQNSDEFTGNGYGYRYGY